MTDNPDPALVADSVSLARVLGAFLAVFGLIGGLAFFLRISIARGWFSALGGFDLPPCCRDDDDPAQKTQDSKDTPNPQIPLSKPSFLQRMTCCFRPDRLLAGGGLIGGRLSGRRRLRIVESLPLDMRRRLVIVACDGQEHLLLLGAQQDMVVASPLPHGLFSGVNSASK